MGRKQKTKKAPKAAVVTTTKAAFSFPCLIVKKRQPFTFIKLPAHLTSVVLSYKECKCIKGKTF